MTGRETLQANEDCELPLAPAVRLRDEGLMGLEDLRKKFMPGGDPIDRASIYRWVSRGFRGVKLPAIRVGRRWFSTEEALEWFVTATTMMGDAPSSRAGIRAMSDVTREYGRDVEELRAYGFTLEGSQ